MGHQKFYMWFSLIAGSIIGGFLACYISASVLAEFSWCIKSEEHCIREWVSALSGWAAFLAAAASIPYLIGQWQEARKQTRFAIGDEDPTLDVVEHLREKNTLVIRFVNWNRRAIFVKHIFVSSAKKPSDMDEYVAVVQVETKDGNQETGFPLQIDGWEDRNNRPNFARIDLQLLRKIEGSEPGTETDEVREFPIDSRITVEIQMLGNVHRMFPLTARAFPDSQGM